MWLMSHLDLTTTILFLITSFITSFWCTCIASEKIKFIYLAGDMLLLKFAAAVLNMVISGEATVVGAHCTIWLGAFCQLVAIQWLDAGRLSDAEHKIPPLELPDTPFNELKDGGVAWGGVGNIKLLVLDVLFGVNPCVKPTTGAPYCKGCGLGNVIPVPLLKLAMSLTGRLSWLSKQLTERHCSEPKIAINSSKSTIFTV